MAVITARLPVITANFYRITSGIGVIRYMIHVITANTGSLTPIIAVILSKSAVITGNPPVITREVPVITADDPVKTAGTRRITTGNPQVPAEPRFILIPSLKSPYINPVTFFLNEQSRNVFLKAMYLPECLLFGLFSLRANLEIPSE